MRPVALPAALLALACLLSAGCGGGSPSASTEATREPPAPSSLAVGSLKVSGGGARRLEVAGGDNSVQEFGTEAGAAELRRAAGSVHSFLVARVHAEWARGCALLDASVRRGLEKLASGSPGSEGEGCPGALATFTEQVSPQLARELTTVDAAALRRQDARGFLVYTGPPGRTVYAMPLTREGRAWRLGAIAGVELPGASGG